MKLQVGSSEVTGRYKRSDWFNLDIEPHEGVDIVADASVHIPLEADSVDEIHCIHVLEHVTRDKNEPMMYEMYRVLKPGGHLYVEVPDFRGTISNLTSAFIKDDVHAIHKWTTSIYGKNERAGMAHFWGFYGHTLFVLFRRVGLRDVEQVLGEENMISGHHKQEPVLLMKGTK